MSLSCSNTPNEGKKYWESQTSATRSKYKIIFMKRLCLFHPCEQSATTATVCVNYKAINRYQVLPTPPSRRPNIQRGKRTHFTHLSDSRCHPEGCKDLRPLFVNTGVLMHLVWKTPHTVESSDLNHAIWSSNRSGNINSVILRKKSSVI